MLASTANALIIGFNIKADGNEYGIEEFVLVHERMYRDKA